MLSRTCTICKNEFPATLEYFYKTRNYLEGYCKQCRSLLGKVYREANKEKLKEKSKVYVEANKDKASLRGKASYMANPEQAKAKSKAYRKNNPEKVKATQKTWRQNNPERVREHARKGSSKRRALRRGNEYIPFTEQESIDLHGTNCHICLEPINMAAPRSARKPGWERGLHMEHVQPSSKGGAHNISNVKPSHAICNLLKATKEIYENKTT